MTKQGATTPEVTVRDFLGRRWLDVVLRAVHLIAVVALGAAVLHPERVPMPEHAGATVVLSGVLMTLLDWWHKPGHLVEGAGLSLVAKLVLVVAMIVVPAWREALFWTIVAWSAVFSHAPARFRNARLLIFRR